MNNNFDFNRIWESKRALRQRLAALPIAEKLRILDALRARAIAIRAAKPIDAFTVKEEPTNYEKR